VRDPNETHFDHRKHGVCLLHAVSLWELANANLSFRIRGSTLVMWLGSGGGKASSGKPAGTAREWLAKDFVLTLSTGFRVAVRGVDTRNGLERLSRAILGEIFLPAAKRSRNPREFYRRGLVAVKKEIAALTASLDEPMTRALLHALIWSGVLKEIDRLGESRIQAN
jgi:hypothetical protein